MTIVPVPEPGTLALFVLGAAGIVRERRRRKSS
ncbi:MAG: PEP-CTERM sorting domain-containing protein [Planctomycetota bacterium]